MTTFGRAIDEASFTARLRESYNALNSYSFRRQKNQTMGIG
jgi:hypothetical protein